MDKVLNSHNMPYSKIASALFVSGIAFVSFGDRILPPSIGQYSQNSRSALLDLVPSIRPQHRDAKAEEAIKNLEQ